MIGIPQFGVRPLDPNGNWTQPWYLFFNNFVNGANAIGTKQPPAPVALTASPFLYRAAANGALLVQGGGVSAMAFSRDGLTWYPVGNFYGMFPLSAGDMLRITYPGPAPTATFVRS